MDEKITMDYPQFVTLIKSKLPVGIAIDNPGGGTSTIISYSEEKIIYRRGISKISVSFEALYKAYNQFKGNKVYTTDLRDFAPTIFDSKRNGHSCNATFFFSILKLLGKVREIKGEGKAHQPFYVSITND